VYNRGVSSLAICSLNEGSSKMPNMPQISSPKVPPDPSKAPAPKQAFPFRLALVAAGGVVLLALLGSIAVIGPTLFGKNEKETPVTPSPKVAIANQVTPKPEATPDPREEDSQQTQPTSATPVKTPLSTPKTEPTSVGTPSPAATKAVSPTLVGPTTPTPGTKLVVLDEFSDNRSAWFTGEFRNSKSDPYIGENVIENGALKIRWKAKGSSFDPYKGRDFTNFIAKVDCTISKGDKDGSCGLLFAMQANGAFYGFEVFNDYYQLSLYQSGQKPLLLTEGRPVGILPNQANSLKVTHDGDQIYLYLNDQLLGNAIDKSLTSGKVGLLTACYNEKGGIELVLDNFTLWELP